MSEASSHPAISDPLDLDMEQRTALASYAEATWFENSTGTFPWHLLHVLSEGVRR